MLSGFRILLALKVWMKGCECMVSFVEPFVV